LAALAPFLTFRFTFLTLAFRLVLRLALDFGMNIESTVQSLR